MLSVSDHSHGALTTLYCTVQEAPCSPLPQTLPLSFPTSTGCIAALGQCSTTLTVTLPANCTQSLQPPYPTVLMFAGYQVPTRYYHTLADVLAQNGYAVIQVKDWSFVCQ